MYFLSFLLSLSADEEPAGAVPGTPVNHSFFQLRITGYTASSEEVGTSYLTDMFRSMCNDNSCVGPWGVTIGSSKGCEVYLPQLTQVQPKHARIEWRSSNPNPTSTPPSADGGRARLTLQDLSGGGRFWISCQPECSQSVKMIVWCDVTKRQRAEPLREPVELCWGVKFGVGNVLFQVFEFSPLELARKCLFGAVRNNDVAVLSAMLDAAKEPNGLEGKDRSMLFLPRLWLLLVFLQLLLPLLLLLSLSAAVPAAAPAAAAAAGVPAAGDDPAAACRTSHTMRVADVCIAHVHMPNLLLLFMIIIIIDNTSWHEKKISQYGRCGC